MTWLDDVNSPPGTEHTVSQPLDVIRHMLTVRERILSCTDCNLRSTCSSPTPFRGPAPAPLTIVGEAPGPVEEREGAPFVGPSGKLLDELMRENLGFDSSTCLVCNTVSCKPADELGGRFRAPYPHEKEACFGNLLAQIALADSNFILVLGRHALASFRTDLNISRIHGRPMHWRNRTVFPTFHPSAALRQSSYRKAISLDLFKLNLLLDNPDAQWPVTCLACGSFEIEFCDDYGVMWCDAHVPEHIRQASVRP